jgi:tRNA threonylcarbamoyladenosine biosynthesis protein TsaE
VITLRLKSAAATEALGARLAGVLTDGCIVYLAGELGTGKTTLVRGLLYALGHRGPVRSPTYTLVEPYGAAGRDIIHLDLYRLEDPEELEFLGLRDWLDGHTVVLVEWPERGGGLLPPADLEIRLEHAGEGRIAHLRGISMVGRGVVAGLGTPAEKG